MPWNLPCLDHPCPVRLLLNPAVPLGVAVRRKAEVKRLAGEQLSRKGPVDPAQDELSRLKKALATVGCVGMNEGWIEVGDHRLDANLLAAEVALGSVTPTEPGSGSCSDCEGENYGGYESEAQHATCIARGGGGFNPKGAPSRQCEPPTVGPCFGSISRDGIRFFFRSASAFSASWSILMLSESSALSA